MVLIAFDNNILSLISGKNKKSKGKVLSLHEFIADKAVPDGFDKKTINWADAMEDEG